MHLIGLNGLSGSGKSTVARFLVERYGCVPLAFADYFKIPAVACGGLPVTEVFGPRPKSDTTRRRLQHLGTEEGRNVLGPDVWVRHLTAHLYRLRMMGVTRVVVDDVRFANESDALRLVEWGTRDTPHTHGAVWALYGRGGLTGGAADHLSEVPMASDYLDWACANTGTTAELFAAVADHLRSQYGWPRRSSDD